MIQIKNPCDANWTEMTPASAGKYCGACEKVVVDFSKMNDTEIKNYFTEYSSQKTCGRFLTSQVERPLVISSVSQFNKFLNRLSQIPITRTVLLFLTSSSMWISSCVKNTTTGEISLNDTTESCDTSLMGDTTAIIEQHDSLLIKQDRDKFEMGKVAPRQNIEVTPPVLMGDISVSPDDTVSTQITCPDKNDGTLQTIMITGKVKMVDTISQKIKYKK